MKNDPFKIRRYRPVDNTPLSSIWYEASVQAHAFLGEERLSQQRALVQAAYLPQAETWVACVNETPVGFIGLIDNFIGGLFVSPHYQGKGIGAALLAHAFRLKGNLSLTVYADNQAAHRFYHHHGFHDVSRHSVDDEGLPFPIIRMRSEG
ncbi:acetyltransferase [Rhizobium sp. Root564]|nr:acetyltransferase [Rhizobium sp. Root564]